MINLSLRAKLIFSFSIVIVLGIILFSVFSIQLIGNTIIKQAQDKVRLDLNSAWEVYNEESRELENIVRLTANRFFIKDALLTKNRTVAREILRKVKNEETLDMITLIDFQRRVFVRAHNTEVWGDSISDNIVERVFDLQRSIVSTRIADSEFLEVEGESFVEQVRMEILPTPKARPLDKELETSGMMIEAAAPVIDYQGEMIPIESKL
jgi:two-component system NtrC family sensor kinase